MEHLSGIDDFWPAALVKAYEEELSALGVQPRPLSV
jgi:hypothetical protein